MTESMEPEIQCIAIVNAMVEIHPVLYVEEERRSTVEGDTLRLRIEKNLYRVDFGVLECVVSDVQEQSREKVGLMANLLPLLR